MAQHPIEVILAKRLASHLAMPSFLVDAMHNLYFYKGTAERLLGQRFADTGEMPVEQWSTAFQPVDDCGRGLPPSELPLVFAVEPPGAGCPVTNGQLCHGAFHRRTHHSSQMRYRQPLGLLLHVLRQRRYQPNPSGRAWLRRKSFLDPTRFRLGPSRPGVGSE